MMTSIDFDIWAKCLNLQLWLIYTHVHIHISPEKSQIHVLTQLGMEIF